MPMSPRLLRPRASGTAVHPEAVDWASRVTTNGGTVTTNTLAAVSKFCADIQAAGIRDRFYRLNLFCGNELEAALVPLYRAERLAASVRGNTTDTNNNFVAADFNNTGSSSGLKGNGTTKFLNTGLNANSLTASDSHMGFGLRATQTGASAYKTLGGAFDTSTRSFEMSVRRDFPQNNCFFTRFNSATDSAGEFVQSSSLNVGDVLMAYPSFYRNGTQAGAQATTSQNYGSAHSIYIFALNQANTAAINHTDARMNWYSVGLTMTAAQAAAFTNAVQAFNTTLSRT